jgi:CO/xanthine dehydrogenase FAD-binding subunit
MNSVFYQPHTIHLALEYSRNQESSTLLAGGTDLVIKMHKDRAPKGAIIDLSKVEELKEISIKGNEIKIGAMSIYSKILDSEILRKSAPILCQAAETVGSPQIRNKATIGGNICNASPAADMIPPLVCLNARLELQSMDSDNVISTRRISIEDFITGVNKTALATNEMLTNIVFNIQSDNSKMNFKKIGRRNALAIARLNGACILNLENNRVSKASLVIGSAAPTPKRFRIVEDYLRGKELNEEVLRAAGILASDYVLQQAGTRSSFNYKLPVVSRFIASLIEDTLRKGEQAYE